MTVAWLVTLAILGGQLIGLHLHNAVAVLRDRPGLVDPSTCDGWHHDAR